jgi:hypothetical protein
MISAGANKALAVMARILAALMAVLTGLGLAGNLLTLAAFVPVLTTLSLLLLPKQDR